MNVNEVIANRAIELAGGAMGSKKPVHLNDHVNMSQSSNDTFPTATYVAAATSVNEWLIPEVRQIHDAIAARARQLELVAKIGRTHLQDATPLTLGQEMGGWANLLERDIARIEAAVDGLYDPDGPGHWTQSAAGVCPACLCQDRRADWTAVPFAPQQVRGSLGTRRR
jgi:fumarate hydratase, class II